LYYVPFATLGAIICAAVVTLVDWPEIIKAFFLSPTDCFVMLVSPGHRQHQVAAVVIGDDVFLLL